MKKLTQVLQSSETHWVGNGFPVRSVFSYNELGRELSPFLLMDYAAPKAFPPGTERRGVEAHPHRGFETVTIAYQGELEHRDSSGGGGKIGPGDVQWMTAAGGIVHEEFHSTDFARAGGTLEMVQLWVNLPAKNQNANPGYQTLLKADIPTVSLPEDSGEARVIAGALAGKEGPARTFTPINLWDVRLNPGKTADLPLSEGHTSAILVLSGKIEVAGKTAKEGAFLIFERAGAGTTVTAKSETKLLVLTGEPIDEPIAGYGPFVMNTEAEIHAAFADFRAGAMGAIH